MIRRKIKETIYEYDKDGNITRKTVTETQEDDDTPVVPYQPQFWYGDGARPRWNDGLTCQSRAIDKTSSEVSKK